MTFDMTVFISPGFNLSSTLAFLEPFRALNALESAPRYRFIYVSASGGSVASQQGPTLETEDIDLARSASDIVLISTSDTPEAAFGAPLAKHLRYWQRQDHLLVGLETGAFALADGGCLDAPAAVHPAFQARFAASYASVGLSDTLFTDDGSTLTCAGGAAGLDIAFHILAERHNPDIVRSVRDYMLAPPPRTGTQPLTVGNTQPLGADLPRALQSAIDTMRMALTETRAIPTIAGDTGMSQRQLERLFRSHTGRSPSQYYRMLRLDRAREMVTRGADPMVDIAQACGFQSPVHFSRAYKEQFGRPPMRDRVRSRIG